MSMITGILVSLPGAASQGVMWGIMTLGVYLTYRILDFADLTVDGSFATGGAVSAVLIMNGVNPFLSLLLAFLVGTLCGLSTGILNTVFKIPPILSGILTMLALYSVNLRIQGKSNIPLLGETTGITIIKNLMGFSTNGASALLGISLSVGIVLVLYWFFGTEIGCSIRATGNNPKMVMAMGINTNAMKILALMVSNGLVALSGGVVTQSQGFGDIGSGTGAIVMGLASIIIGEVIFGVRYSFLYKMSSVIVGSVLYRVVIALVLQLGMRSTDLKLFTAIIVALALGAPQFKIYITRKLNCFKTTKSVEKAPIISAERT